MKKIMIMLLMIFLIIVNLYAANPPADFEYQISDDGTYLVIYGFKNNKSTYIIPETIEGFPVKRVSIGGGGTWNASEVVGNAKQITITLGKNISYFYFGLDHVISNIIITGLSDNLIVCDIVSSLSKPITVKGSIDSLSNLKVIKCYNVFFDNKSLVIKKEWVGYVFRGTNLEELTFEEGISTIGRFDIRGVDKEFPYGNKSLDMVFAENKYLKKVSFPSTLEIINYNTFLSCSKLSELVIPDGLTDILFNADCFQGTALPLKIQAKLRQLGYKDSF